MTFGLVEIVKVRFGIFLHFIKYSGHLFVLMPKVIEIK